MRPAAPSDAHPQQLHLLLFAAHEIRAWEQERSRSTLRRQQARHAPRRLRLQDDSAVGSLFDTLDLAVLQPPLAAAPAGDDGNGDAGSSGEPAAQIRRPALTAGSGDSWSDQAVAQLHEAVLRHSLQALQARGKRAEKREILRWIFAPQPMVAVLRDARGQPFEAVLPQSLTPFSFEQCCRICGFSAERLRDGLMPLLRERGLGNVFNEMANGPKQPEPGGDPQALQDSRDLQHAAGLCRG
ncbi:hypothetical protein [Ramlibacter sp. AN1133]|uniref:hypothetical protein n=1 Tax=Ramlibacter sp. AN1133 TaxID=3133429 RepID=UPI0030C60E26